MNALHTRLYDALQPWRNAPGWCVALSGGLDSTVLLHLLASLAQRETLPPLSAIHIHHGMQAVADAWPAHCRELCAALSVPLQVEYVQVASGASLERAARDARYAAFAARVLVSSTEQVGEIDNRPPLRQIPVLLRGEAQLPQGPGELPPSQPAMPGLEPDLPSLQERDPNTIDWVDQEQKP